MAQNIHASAKVDITAKICFSAKIGPNCVIGPGCIIGHHAELGPNVTLLNNVIVGNNTVIGEGTYVRSFAILGQDPQDMGNEFNPDSKLIIGKNCKIWEFVTISRGTPKGNKYAGLVLTTVIGDDCKLLTSSHIGHDCCVGNSVTLTNGVMLGGHVTVEDFANFGGGAAIHQFCRVGKGAFVGGKSGANRDVPPFAKAIGDNRFLSTNDYVLKNIGYSEEEIKAVKDIYSYLYRGEYAFLGDESGEVLSSKTFEERVAVIASKLNKFPRVIAPIIGFIQESLGTSGEPEWRRMGIIQKAHSSEE